MTTRALFIAVNVILVSALLLAFAITIQLVRAKHADIRRRWLRWTLVPAALYIFSLLPLSAGFLFMHQNARFSAGGIVNELQEMINEPGVLWRVAAPLLIYTVVIAIASFASDRRFQASRV